MGSWLLQVVCMAMGVWIVCSSSIGQHGYPRCVFLSPIYVWYDVSFFLVLAPWSVLVCCLFACLPECLLMMKEERRNGRVEEMNSFGLMVCRGNLGDG